MDPIVTASKNAPEQTKELWAGHGNLSSYGYSDESITSLGALIEYSAKRDLFHQLTNVIAAEYSRVLYRTLVDANETKTQPTVALFGHGNTMEYYITQMALQKLNIRTLLLGDKIPPEAMCSLIERCSALALIIESGLSLRTQDLRQIPMIEDPFSRAENPSQRQETLRFDDGQDQWERQVFIFHSTGSTGPPKPVIHTNGSILTISKRHRLFLDVLFRNCLLMFSLHAVTGFACVIPSGYAYNIPTTFPPRSLSLSNCSASAIVDTLSLFSAPSSEEQRPEIDSISTNPSHIVGLYHHIRSTTKDFTPLRQLKLVDFAGAPLDRSVLQGLVKERVNVKQYYGTSELGSLLRTYPNDISNNEIEKMRIMWPEGSGLVMEPLGQGLEAGDELPIKDVGKERKQGQDNDKEQEQEPERRQTGNDRDTLYELIAYPSFPAAAVLSGPSSHTGLPPPNPSAQTISFREVPPKGSGYYVLEGRRDDIISVKWGGSVNAAAIEQRIIGADPGIKNALLIRPGDAAKMGLLVEVHRDVYAGERGSDRMNEEGVEEDASVHEKEVRECVRRAVERVNTDLLEWERVQMGMIKVLDRGTRLPVTGKGNVKRKEAERVLGKEIDLIMQSCFQSLVISNLPC
ncbi:hypothetical protein G7Y79_00055g089950 [Physcia stellaris]|nr:hypothetical protein G7Y79_00055g089950 [Physcia stellaris]